MAFFDIKPLIKEYNPQYTLLYGQRSNGKSWSVKDLAIKRFIKDGQKFFYLRRYDMDLKSGGAADYWNKYVSDPAGLKKATKGQYVDVYCYGGNIYLIKPGKKKEKVHCGYYGALSLFQRYKSREYPDCTLIIFEEFMTKSCYLEDEYSKMQSIVSTCARNAIINVIMIGNTESRVCPYFDEFGIPEVFKMKSGTQELYHQYNHRGDQIDILCIHAPEVDNSETDGKSMFFGKSSKTILSGEWDVNDYPIRPHIEYTVIYEMLIEFKSFHFIMQLCISEENEQLFILVMPNKNNRKMDRIITEEVDTDPMHSPCFLDRIRPEKVMMDLWKVNKVFYSNLLTANDFNTCLVNSKMVL